MGTKHLACSPAQAAYIRQRKQHKYKVLLVQIALFCLLIGCWEGFTQAGILDSFIFSSPSRMVKTSLVMAQDGSLFYHTGITILETLISFFLIMIIGIVVAVLLWQFPTFHDVMEPYLIVLNSLPKSALAPLFIVWFGNNMKTIIIAAVSVAVFGTIITIYTGFQSVEPEKIKLIQTLGGTKRDILFRVIIPSNLATIFSSMKVNIGLSLVGVIIGEFLAANAGLGYLIIYGTQVFKLDLVLLSIVILCILAVILYQCIHFLQWIMGKKFDFRL
jgi:NitT/TauT family transport system permease protein